MEQRERAEKTYRFFRRIYDFSIATLIIGMGVVMLGAKWLHIEQMINFDSTMRWLFGFMCLAYGGFRAYRGWKQQY